MPKKITAIDLYSGLINIVCKLGLNVATLLIILNTVLIGVNVVLRYVFHYSILGMEELVSASLTIIVMLSAPEVLRRNSHIGVDILIGFLSPFWVRVARVWSFVAVLAVSLLFIVNGWDAMQLSKLIGALTEGYMEIPVWILQLFLPLGGVLLALAAIEQLLKPANASMSEDEIQVDP